jgi:S-adenosylmethionine synthetase
MSDVRRNGELPDLHPDGHVQVALRYHNRQPQCIEGITIFSALYADTPKSREVSEEIRRLIIDPVVNNSDLAVAKGCMISINPVDTVNIGGPTRHAGLTGRKTDIDTYGGYSRHSGAALSGKDPSRIDRTGAYAARYAAKTIVASGLADECEVQISYTMGRPEPISLEIDTFGSAKLPEAKIRKVLCETIDFNVNAIIDTFKLEEQPKICGGRFFTNLAVFGHFGRDDLRLPWEKTDKAALLARYV